MAGAICYSNPRIETSSRVEAVGGVADQVERCGPASEGVSWEGGGANILRERASEAPTRLAEPSSGDEPYGA